MHARTLEEKYLMCLRLYSYREIITTDYEQEDSFLINLITMLLIITLHL